jgi:hypothetical protein
MDNQVFYFLYVNGRQTAVSQKEWERSWLDWWHRINKIQELE